MLCGKCGTVYSDDQAVCPVCGTPAEALRAVKNTRVERQSNNRTLSTGEKSGKRIQKINPTVYVAPEIQQNLRKAERSKPIGTAAVIFSVFFPPLGTILGAAALAKADNGLKITDSANCRAGRILGAFAVVMSIITTLGVIRLLFGFFAGLYSCMGCI